MACVSQHSDEEHLTPPPCLAAQSSRSRFLLMMEGKRWNGAVLASPVLPHREELVLPYFSPHCLPSGVIPCPSPGHLMVEETCTVPSPKGQWWGIMALHKATCGWEPPLISCVGLSSAWSQAIWVMGKQLQDLSELPWTPILSAGTRLIFSLVFSLCLPVVSCDICPVLPLPLSMGDCVCPV